MTSKPDIGRDLMSLITELYPICRSITGDGTRQTLARLSEIVPLQIHEVPTGTSVLDWEIPDEWNIRDAWIKDRQGRRIVDFQQHNLHVVNYSEPVHRWISRSELLPHLHSLPEHPDWIPYRTSYYDRTWGFCVTGRQLDELQDDEYEVCVDSTLGPGNLTYGEVLIPGSREDEIVISSHICHPSLCNDNLSGVAIAILLARKLMTEPRKFSVRFLFAPGTIGAITWLARNRELLARVKGGLTLVCLGDRNPWTYKKSFQGSAALDRVTQSALANSGLPYECVDFSPYGYDERQYNSPGFRLPFGSLMRGRHGEFAEYHTSADNLEFVSESCLAESFELVDKILWSLDDDRYYRNQAPYGEPQLGRRGIYELLDGDSADLRMAILWTLNMSDGSHSLMDISDRSGISFEMVANAADLLSSKGLLKENEAT